MLFEQSSLDQDSNNRHNIIFYSSDVKEKLLVDDKIQKVIYTPTDTEFFYIFK